MSSGRRHSVSGNHYRSREGRDYDYNYDSAYASREDEDDRYHYDRRRESSRRAPSRTASRHPPDLEEGRRGRRRTTNYEDDYDPRDKYYLSGEEDIGFRSQSAQPQRTPWDEPTQEGSDHEDNDYFNSRKRQPAEDVVRDRSPHGRERSTSYNPSHRGLRDEYDYDRYEPSDRRRSRRDAPPMLRRQSSSEPPPADRSRYPPRAGGRGERSRYPPSTTETRNYRGSRRPSRSDRDRDRDRDYDWGRRSKSSHDNDRGGRRNSSRDDNRGGWERSKSKSKKESAFSDSAWSQAARCALQAGTMAALESVDSPGNWIGLKGAQIATAAMGAALVDGIIANKNPGIRGGKRHSVLRQVTNTALSKLVMTPAGNKAEAHDVGGRSKNAIQNRMRRGGGGRRR